MKKKLGLRLYMIILFAIFGIVLIATVFPILRRSVTQLEEDLIANRLVADIHYIEDIIGDGEWNLKGDTICRGDVEVGDGTQEHANLEPFLRHEEKTGTFSYVFIRCGDEGLGYVESTPTQAGYQEGHFLRVAGSTRDPNGDSIVDKSMDIFIMCDRANIALSSMQPDADVTIAYYNDSMMENILRENTIMAEFEHALRDGQFRVFLQPIVEADGRVTGAEALVRWFRGDSGVMVPPADFIGILEKAGLIYRMDLFVWEEAARILSSWKGTGLSELSISVNISPRDILYVDILQTFEDLVARHEIPRGKLNLEFTESTLMSDVDRYIELVASLREKGFHVEIDDFGSGYSSLNMLKDIRADVLKIDMGFLRETENREQSRVILASIMEMSKKLHMTVIIEGVEKESQIHTLAGMGCDLFQGYYFSKPIPVEEFEEKYLSEGE